jgi:hypothetical protein
MFLQYIVICEVVSFRTKANCIQRLKYSCVLPIGFDSVIEHKKGKYRSNDFN